jgi:hypothetical protein
LKKAAVVPKKAPSEAVAIISYDEKPGIQAIATTAPDLPPEPGVHATFVREHEYKLEAISSFLDRQHEMAERVRRDLVRGLKKPRKGRHGLTAPQVLRSLVLMRVKNWDYRELRERIADGLTLRTRPVQAALRFGESGSEVM